MESPSARHVRPGLFSLSFHIQCTSCILTRYVLTDIYPGYIMAISLCFERNSCENLPPKREALILLCSLSSLSSVPKFERKKNKAKIVGEAKKHFRSGDEITSRQTVADAVAPLSKFIFQLQDLSLPFRNQKSKERVVPKHPRSKAGE